MTDVRLDLQGIAAGFDEYRQFTRLLAERDNPDATLVAWADRARAAFRRAASVAGLARSRAGRSMAAITGAVCAFR